MACPPSARFEEEFEEVETEFAKEGDSAHHYADALLRCELGGNDGADVGELQEFLVMDEYYNAEMEESVGLYIDIIHERFQEALKRDPSAILMSEQRLEYSEFVPEGFGTGDAMIISMGTLEIIDLKYGKGIPVFAQGNPQLRMYGLAAWNTYKILYDIDTVRMTIVQPRLGSVTTETIKTQDLLRWANEEVRPKALLAWAGEGEFASGDHCQFCKAMPRCKKIAEENMEMAKHDFALPHKLEDDEIVDILSRVDRLTKWAKAIQEYALGQARDKGKKWDGWKLVEGRSNRRLADTEKALGVLSAEGISEPLLYKPREPLALGALETLVGKKKLNTLLDGLIIKPAGKPTLVPETDKRAELNSAKSAAADFK